MRLLAVPNWSFGRNRALTHRFADILDRSGTLVHYFKGDVDHNCTVTAFSGSPKQLHDTILELAEASFPSIDLNRHVGVHPRIGALDVCPFVQLPGAGVDPAVIEELVDRVSSSLAERWRLPIFLYEKSERGRHEADLPSLRKGGFGGLAGRLLKPDYGPATAHPHLGVTVLGWRDFLIAMNVNLKTADPSTAKALAREARSLRSDGDARFLGVRALGFPLPSRHKSQVSFNLTMPDVTSCDELIDWVSAKVKGSISSTELIGVIRSADLPEASRLPIKPYQVVDRPLN